MAGKSVASRTFYLRTALLAVLLAAAIGGWLLLATGSLPAGLTGPVIVSFYLMLGLLVAVTTFGVLKSSADVRGKPYGFAVQAGGPFAGVVLVIACLVAAEKCRPRNFNFAIDVRPSQPTPALTGSVAVTFGVNRLPERLDGNRAKFVDVDDMYADRNLDVMLDVPGWRPQRPTIRTKRNETVILDVEPVPDFCDSVKASKDLKELHEMLVGRIPAFELVGRDYVKAAFTGNGTGTDDTYTKALEGLSDTQAYAEALEALPACLDDVRHAERFADAAYSWTMSALYSRQKNRSGTEALGRLGRAGAAVETAYAVLKRIDDDAVKRQVDLRSLPVRLPQYEAYRWAMLDPVQHRSRILDLRARVGADANGWANDAVLEYVIQPPRTQ